MVVDPHDTLVMPSFGSGHRISVPEDHDEPFQTSAPPSGAPARQKPVVGHEMWLYVSEENACVLAEDHDVPFHMTALPTTPGPVEPTATQKVTDGHETDARPSWLASIGAGADHCNVATAAVCAAEVVVGPCACG